MSQFNAIGAHIYAGGFTVGVARYFNVLAHLEESGYGRQVVGLNFPNLPIVYPSRDWGPTLDKLRALRGAERVRFVYANPPCAPFSQASAGRALGWDEDARLAQTHDCFRLLQELEPDVLAIESVTQAWTKAQSLLEDLAEQAARQGYSSTVLLHDAKLLGVPQRRARVFHLYHRVKLDDAFDEELSLPLTVRQAWRGLRLPKKPPHDLSLPPAMAAIAGHVEPGRKFAEAFDQLYPDPPRGDRGQVVGRPAFTKARLRFDAPSPVVLAASLVHPTENRFLYPQELARLASFPDSYKWPVGASHADVSGWISRGVSPAVGEWLARGVSMAIMQGKKLNHRTMTVIDRRQYIKDPVVHKEFDQ